MADKANGVGKTIDRVEIPPGHEQIVVAGSALVSIIIPCCGQLEYTRLCVPSVLRYSRDPFELIFIDIGSLDGTAEYLEGIAAAAGDDRAAHPVLPRTGAAHRTWRADPR